MKHTPVPDILRQIASISAMEPGRLSIIRKGPNDRNHTKHIPAEQVPEVERNTAAYALFTELVDRYAGEHLLEVGGIPFEARHIQRLVQDVGKAAAAWLERADAPPQSCDADVLYVSADATGVPMRKEELAGRRGKRPDGSSKTRMAMLACVFTQHGLDENGLPLRGYQSTTYLGALQGTSDIGPALHREARRRGLASAGKEQQVEPLLGYFERNAGHMMYGTYRKQGLFICSGVIGSRCKHSGMFWSQDGVNNIIALAGHRTAEFWQDRMMARAASNLTKFFKPAA